MDKSNTQTSRELPKWVIQIREQGRILEPLCLPKGQELPKGIQKRRMHRLPPTLRREIADYKPYKVSLGPWSANYDDDLAKEKYEFTNNELQLLMIQTKEALNKIWQSVWPCKGHTPDLLIQLSNRKEVKLQSLLHFLWIFDIEIERCYDALREVVDDLMDAYDQLDKRWRYDAEAFLHMMLLDGCFLIEFIRTNRHYRNSPHAPDDLVNPVIWRLLENGEEKNGYVHDLLLLENQLPVMLLSTLLSLYPRQNDDSTHFHFERIETEKLRRFMTQKDIDRLKQMEEDKRVQERVVTFLDIAMITFGTTCMLSNDELKSSLHLLDAYRKNLLYRGFRKPLREKETWKFSNIYIPSATKLLEVGIRFTANTYTTSLLDIRLRRNTLHLPEIIIDGSTKSTFLNLIAFEKLHKNYDDDDVEMEVTTYMYIMGRLVQSAEDVSLLQSRGIITTALHAAETANLFHGMSKDIPLDPSDTIAPEYVEMLTMLRSCFNKMSNEWRKDLSQTYLRTPWKIMSIMAAFSILALSFIQTLYTVLGYIHRK